MRFRNIHPTQIDDDVAHASFIALAAKWPDIDHRDLARAFVRGSLYDRALPETMRGGGPSETTSTYAALLPDLPATCGSFVVTVQGPRRLVFELVAATTAKQLQLAWGRAPHKYGRIEYVQLEEQARRYRERHGETHVETLRRASDEIEDV